MSDPIYRVDTEEEVVYLTFDDGPYVDADVAAGRVTATTAELLDRLANLRDNVVHDPDLSATFYVNGWTFVKGTPDHEAPDEPNHPDAVARREIANRMLAEGHDLANHSQHHLNPWGLPTGLNSVEDMVREITLTQAAEGLLPPVGGPVPGVNEVGSPRLHLRSPGDPSYQTGQAPALPLFNNPDAPATSIERFHSVVSAALEAGLRYTSFNLWAKDDPANLPPESVYWHAIDVSRWNTISGQAPDRDLLSFEDLARHEPFTRRGAILLMHNGRRHTATALGPSNGLEGVIPYIYSQGFKVRRVPPLDAP